MNLQPDRSVNMLGEGVKKIYLDEQPLSGQGQNTVMYDPRVRPQPKPLKPLKFRL